MWRGSGRVVLRRCVIFAWVALRPVKQDPVLCRAVLCVAQGNVRGLLGSLQTVLWEDSGWQPINMGDLLEPAQVGWVCVHAAAVRSSSWGICLSAGWWKKVLGCSIECAVGGLGNR